MKTIFLSQSIEEPLSATVATLGFFDGVHRGHLYLLQELVRRAQQAGLPSTVVTLDRHPREVLQPSFEPQLLTTLEQRLVLLSQTGVDQVVVLPFTSEMAALTSQQFIEQVLHKQLHVQQLLLGHDNRFGSDLNASFDDYVRCGRTLGMEVLRHEALELQGQRVSSTTIRQLLQEGKVAQAAELLGRPYALVGKVVQGYREGRQLGFPTANIDLGSSHQVVPANGVYAIQARVSPSVALRPGMMNIGTRPTFGGTERSIEAFIFQFKRNLYGQEVTVTFHERLRSERKFDSVEQLVEQLHEDQRQVEQLFSSKREENDED